MQAPEWIWEALGIEATREERAIKRAYAAKLKRTRPEENPQEFQRLRVAYETALACLAIQPAETSDTHDISETADAANTANPVNTLDTTTQPNYTSPPDTLTTSPPILMAQPPAHAPWLQEAPHIVAEKCWAQFIGNTPNAKTLQTLLQSEELFGLEARDAFELHAAAYCANEEHERHLASLLIETFEWNENITHLQKLSPQLAKSAMGRYYAHKEFDALLERAADQPTLKYLLGQQLPPRFIQIHLADRRFTRAIQGWAYTLRWRCSDVIEYNLNQNVFNTWFDLANAKRYFLQTALASFLFGLPVCAVFMAGYALFEQNDAWLQNIDLIGGFFLAGEMCSFAAIAWLSFFPESRIARWLTHIKEDVLHKPLNVYRFEMRVHIGVICLFGLLSLSFLLPNNPWQTEQSILMLVSLLSLIYIGSADLKWIELGIGIAIGPLLAIMQHQPEKYAFNFASCAMFFSGLLILLQRGTAPWLRWFNRQQLYQSRCAWIAVVFLWIIANLIQPEWRQHPTMPISGALLLLFGLQICSFFIHSSNRTLSFVRAYFISQIAIGLSAQDFTGPSRFIFGCLLFYILLAVSNLFEDHGFTKPNT